ncbi:AbrB family transcriptional regulator [Rhodococcus aerolatus]
MSALPRCLRTPVGRWALLVLGTAGVGAVLTALGVPSAALFGSLLVAAVLAPAGLGPAGVPRPVFLAAQAVLGVVIGALVEPGTLASLAADWFPVVLVSLGTLVLTVLAGLLLGRHRAVDPLTGSLALIAGGASGLTAISRELGADERLVAVVQYVRVALVVLLMPAVTALVFRPTGTAAPAAVQAAGAPWWAGWALVAGCAALGVSTARLLRLPAGGLLGPMILSAVAGSLGLSGGASAPAVLVLAAYAAIGWQAGLGFTRESVRVLGRVLVPAVGLILAVLVGCGGLGLALSAMTGASELDAYLATTPGGVYAVLATSASAGGDVTFVLTVQLLRVFVMLLAAPALARLLARRRAPAA